MSAWLLHLQLCPRGSRWLWLAQHPGEGEMPWWAGWHVSGSQCLFLSEFAMGLAEIRGFWRGSRGRRDQPLPVRTVVLGLGPVPRRASW